MKEWLNFDREHHMKEKVFGVEESIDTSTTTSDESETSSHHQNLNSSASSINSYQESSSYEQDHVLTNFVQVFKRMFSNLDQTTCWLNSCLQLILNAMDHSDCKLSWTSELGKELSRLQSTFFYI